jgi:cytochrome oxidase assembly protein ShyY1
VLVVALTCVWLGVWQLDRLEQRRAFNASVERGLKLAPQPLERLIPPGAEPDPDSLSYRRAEVQGIYDDDREVVLFGRSLDGTPGNHVLTPLVTQDGRALIVDRGWVPLHLGRPPIGEAVPPSGTVRVTGVLFPPEEQSPSSGSTEAVASFTKIDLGRLGRQLPYPVHPVYLWLRSQDPSQPGALPRPVPLPELTEGPHLSYAVQWFIFSAIALVGLLDPRGIEKENLMFSRKHGEEGMARPRVEEVAA